MERKSGSGLMGLCLVAALEMEIEMMEWGAETSECVWDIQRWGLITLSLVASKAYGGDKMNERKLRGVGLIWDKVRLTKCVCVCVWLCLMVVICEGICWKHAKIIMFDVSQIYPFCFNGSWPIQIMIRWQRTLGKVLPLILTFVFVEFLLG